ncbi:MAG: hypothetical protein JW882_09970 [Deltaproteobacteria bacterium]|nr:hypothetical protein [Deltaproteobacteria bacterium]
MELTLTKHFEERWMRHFNSGPPSPMQVLRIISQSKWLHKGQNLFKKNGEPYKLLSEYWHPQRKIIIRVDWDTSEAVTLLTEES